MKKWMRKKCPNQGKKYIEAAILPKATTKMKYWRSWKWQSKCLKNAYKDVRYKIQVWQLMIWK